jgi:hypothetical protein
MNEDIQVDSSDDDELPELIESDVDELDANCKIDVNVDNVAEIDSDASDTDDGTLLASDRPTVEVSLPIDVANTTPSYESDTETVIYEHDANNEMDVEPDFVDDNAMTSKCGTIKWSRQPSRMFRQPPWNILTETSGVPSNIIFSTINDAFSVFFNESIVEHILRFTNQHGREIKEHTPSFRWNADLSPNEFRAFCGLLIIAGVQRCKNQSVIELWDEQWGFPVFRTTMSYHRFIDILRALRFDDKSTRVQRQTESGNQAEAIQELLDLFTAPCRTSYRCGPCVTIDEQLVTFHGNCRFRMYIPSKPGKYGLKMWVMADADTFYCANAQLYAGKVGNRPDVGQGSRVVMDLTTYIRDSGRNVTTDNFFTSYGLARELQKCCLSLVGTVRGNRREIPPEMGKSSSREVHSSLFGFSPDGVTMVSYVPKRGKAVTLLSSQHHDAAVMPDGERKPEIINYYHKTKAGVDVLDKLVRTYSCKRSTRRWTVSLFFNLIDIAALNALVLWITANPDWNSSKSHRRRLFLRELGMQLVDAHVRDRLSRPQAKRRQIQNSAQQSGFIVVDDHPRVAEISESKRLRRCVSCPRKKEQKTTRQCALCGRATCTQHSAIHCHQCGSKYLTASEEAASDADDQ